MKLPEKVFGVSVSLLRLFVIPFLVLLGFIISFNLVIMPRFSELSGVNKSIDLVEKQTDMTIQKINYLSSVDQEQIKLDADSLESAVLQEKNSYLLVGVVRGIADKYGYLVNSFSIGSIDIKSGQDSIRLADKNVAVRLPLDVSLSGPTDKKIELLTAIEHALPILFIDDLKMTNDGDDSTLAMTISSYYVADNDLSINDLSLSDLIPTTEENDLLKTIGSFSRVSDGSSFGIGSTLPFVKYERVNPFTL